MVDFFFNQGTSNVWPFSINYCIVSNELCKYYCHWRYLVRSVCLSSSTFLLKTLLYSLQTCKRIVKGTRIYISCGWSQDWFQIILNMVLNYWDICLDLLLIHCLGDTQELSEKKGVLMKHWDLQQKGKRFKSKVKKAR